MNANAHVELLTQLSRLEQVLVDEDAALRRFDPTGIARAAEAKAELEPELERAFAAVATAPTATRRAELLAVRQRVAARGRDNLVRLQATLGCVRELVDRATGRSRATYGKPRGQAHVETVPVLASEVG